jgi:hypothetical protein
MNTTARTTSTPKSAILMILFVFSCVVIPSCKKKMSKNKGEQEFIKVMQTFSQELLRGEFQGDPEKMDKVFSLFAKEADRIENLNGGKPYAAFLRISIKANRVQFKWMKCMIKSDEKLTPLLDADEWIIKPILLKKIVKQMRVSQKCVKGLLEAGEKFPERLHKLLTTNKNIPPEILEEFSIERLRERAKIVHLVYGPQAIYIEKGIAFFEANYKNLNRTGGTYVETEIKPIIPEKEMERLAKEFQVAYKEIEKTKELLTKINEQRKHAAKELNLSPIKY